MHYVMIGIRVVLSQQLASSDGLVVRFSLVQRARVVRTSLCKLEPSTETHRTHHDKVTPLVHQYVMVLRMRMELIGALNGPKGVNHKATSWLVISTECLRMQIPPVMDSVLHKPWVALDHANVSTAQSVAGADI